MVKVWRCIVAGAIAALTGLTVLPGLGGTALQAGAKALGTEAALVLSLTTIGVAALRAVGARLMDARTRRTARTVSLIATLVARCVLLLSRLLFVFLFVFEFHNFSFF